MPAPSPWPDAVLAGIACSMRSLSGPALLAARGRIIGRPRQGLLLAAAGEVVADKLPFAIDRIARPALAGRVATGALTGYGGGGPVDGAVSAAVAAVGTYVTWRLRAIAVQRTGWPDALVALAEDLLAYTLAAAATRSSVDTR